MSFSLMKLRLNDFMNFSLVESALQASRYRSAETENENSVFRARVVAAVLSRFFVTSRVIATPEPKTEKQQHGGV